MSVIASGRVCKEGRYTSMRLNETGSIALILRNGEPFELLSYVINDDVHLTQVAAEIFLAKYLGIEEAALRERLSTWDEAATFGKRRLRAVLVLPEAPASSEPVS